jgi:tetratricopeptide (TPR) repeat protein
VALAPDAAFMLVRMADALMAFGRYDEAIEPLRRALRLDGRLEAALEGLEMSCHRAGRQEEALDARRALLGLRGASERMQALTEQPRP